jgi:hypothetical protein
MQNFLGWNRQSRGGDLVFFSPHLRRRFLFFRLRYNDIMVFIQGQTVKRAALFVAPRLPSYKMAKTQIR